MSDLRALMETFGGLVPCHCKIFRDTCKDCLGTGKRPDYARLMHRPYLLSAVVAQTLLVKPSHFQTSTCPDCKNRKADYVKEFDKDGIIVAGTEGSRAFVYEIARQLDAETRICQYCEGAESWLQLIEPVTCNCVVILAGITFTKYDYEWIELVLKDVYSAAFAICLESELTEIDFHTAYGKNIPPIPVIKTPENFY